MNYQQGPLNINLIIPFKDNRGRRLELYKAEIDRFKEQLCGEAEALKERVLAWFGTDFDLTIAARSDGYTKKYYWRFKSSSRDRKFNRLQAPPVIDYLKQFRHPQIIRLKEAEETLIYLNANLKVIKGMNDAICQCMSERDELHALSL